MKTRRETTLRKLVRFTRPFPRRGRILYFPIPKKRTTHIRITRRNDARILSLKACPCGHRDKLSLKSTF